MLRFLQPAYETRGLDVKVECVREKDKVHWERVMDEDLDLPGEALHFDVFLFDADLVLSCQVENVLDENVIAVKMGAGAADFGPNVALHAPVGKIRGSGLRCEQDHHTQQDEKEKTSQRSFTLTIFQKVDCTPFGSHSSSPAVFPFRVFIDRGRFLD
jgi:hypothetical protein